MRTAILGWRRWSAAAWVGAAVVVLLLAAVPGAAMAASGLNLTRIATDDNYADDELAAIGDTPACLGTPEGENPATYLADPVVPYLKQATVWSWTPLDAEALAACKPTVIVSDNESEPAENPTTANAYQAIATTVYVPFKFGCYSYTYPPADDIPSVDANPSGTCFTSWKNQFVELGQALGPATEQRVGAVIANVDRRAAAVHGQVAGKTVAWLSILPSDAEFEVFDGNFPFMNGIRRDLGTAIPSIPADDYGSSCSWTLNGGNCGASNWLSYENFPDIDDADAVVVQTGSATSAEIQTVESNPLFEQIPAVKAGRVTQGSSLIAYGPLAEAGYESMIEGLFGIDEYNASLSGGAGPYTLASLTYAASTRKLCWAVNPPAGRRPKGAFTLALPDGRKSLEVTLSKAPRYASSETSAGWNTSPATYVGSGCTTLSGAEAGLWKSDATRVTATVGADRGQVKAGAASIVYSSPPEVTTQPRAQSAAVGQTVTFTALATGDPAPTIRWEYSADHGKHWTVVPGAFRSSRTTGKLTRSENGRWYRAEFLNTAGITFSKGARVTVRKG